MPCMHRHAITARGNPQRLLRVEVEGFLIGRKATEDFECLPFHFFFFAGYVRDDVIQYIDSADAWISRPRNSLHSSDDHLIDCSEFGFESSERNDECGRGTVRVGDYESLLEGRRVEGLLVGDYGEVVGVYEGDEEGHGGVAAVVFGV